MFRRDFRDTSRDRIGVWWFDFEADRTIGDEGVIDDRDGGGIGGGGGSNHVDKRYHRRRDDPQPIDRPEMIP